MDVQRINYLLGEFQAGSLPAGELEELRVLLLADEHQQYLTEAISAAMQARKADPAFNAEGAGELFKRIISIDKSQESLNQSILTADLKSVANTLGPNPSSAVSSLSDSPPVHRVHFLKTTWFRYAAVIICMVATGAYLWFRNTPERLLTNTHKQLPVNIKPGREGAILTLADGSQLVLDSLKDGIIAEQSGSKILLEDGNMIYHAGGENTATMAYNNLSTPKGRQYKFILPDGTKVWLNAASSIRYPTVFAGANRKVEMKGEAYFEVAKNKNKPFLVQVDQTVAIEVLGTSFNLKAYENEGVVQTTLVEGMVKVENLSKDQPGSINMKVVLQPGQQATVLPAGNRDKAATHQPGSTISIAQHPNIEKIIAWKKGIFNFEGSSLVEVMRELERWYNIEVVYEGAPPVIRFVGKLQKDLTLNDLLDILIKSNVKFELDGGKLIIKG